MIHTAYQGSSSARRRTSEATLIFCEEVVEDRIITVEALRKVDFRLPREIEAMGCFRRPYS